MSRRPSPRRHAGRRPPNRHSTWHGPPKPQGFTGPSFRQLYKTLFPDLKGVTKKQYFNDLTNVIVLAAALCGGLLGLMTLGWFGALIGLGAGIATAESFVETNRFRRE